jgi:hypothetical protein
MRRVRQAVIQSRVYLRHPGLLRASLANLPVRESTCRIYLPRDTPRLNRYGAGFYESQVRRSEASPAILQISRNKALLISVAAL